MEETTFSKIVLYHTEVDIFKSVEMSVDENADNSGDLLLMLEAVEKNLSEVSESKKICVEYFSEKQMLEMYFFLKANLMVKYGHSL